jgi:hypothetical protein
MARLPRLKLSAKVILPRLPQFAHEARILSHQPIFQLIQVVHGFQDLGGNFNGIGGRFHLG